jgi:hypothetical protein
MPGEGSTTSSLRQKARRAINAGDLPHDATLRAWGGDGTGIACALCGLTIEQGEVEIELGAKLGLSPRFHLACHTAWQEACEELQQTTTGG